MIRFRKMHGNGNDFVLLENLTHTQQLTKAKVIKMGDRKKGIGFDQLITINPPKKPFHDFYIRFFNTDGSEAIMCLNGVRSVGAFLWKENLFPKKTILLGTKSRTIQIDPTNSKQVKATIDFPSCIEIPKFEKRFLRKTGIQKYCFVDTGNSHLLIESSRHKIHSCDLSALSEILRTRKIFKDTNISLFMRERGAILIRTNEAGAGETLSCGSASAAIASISLNRKNNIAVISKGGKITLKKINGKLEMIGPAEFVCEGTWQKK